MSTPQLPLGLRFGADHRLDTFRESIPGVLELLRRLARGDGGDAVFLSGPSGAGKTHLLLAACTEAAARDIEVAYLPLRTYGVRQLDAITSQPTVVLACIDDVDAIAGSREAQIGLFNLHNRFRAAGSAIVYAANAPPAQLNLALPDLQSRLAQCVQLALLVPDEAARREILRSRALTRGLELDNASLDWMFRRIDRDLTTLTALLDRLDRASLAAQRRITVPFLRQTLQLD